jgi:hypothetical protein
MVGMFVVEMRVVDSNVADNSVHIPFQDLIYFNNHKQIEPKLRLMSSSVATPWSRTNLNEKELLIIALLAEEYQSEYCYGRNQNSYLNNWIFAKLPLKRERSGYHLMPPDN